MAIRYIPRFDEHRYTALSTDDLAQQKFDHGSRVYLTDTHTTLIYNETTNTFDIDSTEDSSVAIMSNGDSVNLADLAFDDNDILNKVTNIDRFITGNVEERELRRGNQFGAGHVWSNVANNASVVLHYKTGSVPIYLSYGVSCVGLTDYGQYTNPTFSNDGTLIEPTHRNQMVNFPHGTNVYYDPTYTSLGTVRIPRFLGSGTNPTSRLGGESNERTAIIAPNTDMFIVATNVSGVAQSRMGLYVEWFEVDYLDYS